MINTIKYNDLLQAIKSYNASLVAVSKTKSIEDIQAFAEIGQIDFGENYVQELVAKQTSLSSIQWHFIGHLQSNKVKYIAPFIHLIQSADSIKLLQEINRCAIKNNRIINCLLQIYIAKEESKFGFDIDNLQKELIKIISNKDVFSNIKIIGLMGMATQTTNTSQIRHEYKSLKNLFDILQQYKNSVVDLRILSMGMSNDYKIALDEGSTMIRIGSLLFGERR